MLSPRTRTAYATITPFHLEKLGFEPVMFHPKDYGFDFYGDILFTMEQFIDEHPDTVEAFYEATLKGWKYAFAHIFETVDTIKTKYNTQDLPRDLLMFEAEAFRQPAFVGDVPFGNINPIKIEKIVNSFRHLGVVDNASNNFESYIYRPPSQKSTFLSQEEREYVAAHPLLRVGVREGCYPYDYHDATGPAHGCGTRRACPALPAYGVSLFTCKRLQ
jgi:polar amino acid transport system substrate-binding protein